MLEMLNVSDYEKGRAVMATFFNAALLASPDRGKRSLEAVATEAIHAAEAMLNQLGIVDPDQL